MLYLASKLWIWLLVGGMAGFLTGWLSCSGAVDDPDQ